MLTNAVEKIKLIDLLKVDRLLVLLYCCEASIKKTFKIDYSSNCKM